MTPFPCRPTVGPLTVGSLFSGIGGLELGLERAGMRTVWQVEQNDYCRKVLAKHWPDVPKFIDVRDVGARNLPPVDLICGGFPCQDNSNAASGWKRPGVAGGERSGLWREFARIIREMRPRWAIIENVEAIRYAGRGLDCVLGDLAALGYDAEWNCVRASDAGAPHRRSRIWLVAYPNRRRESGRAVYAEASELSRIRPSVRQWPDPPRGLRVDDGLSSRMDRLRAIGNAVVPQVAEFIGRLIVEADAARSEAVA